MRQHDYSAALARAMEAINSCLGSEFSPDKVLLQCFQTDNEKTVFQKFCTDYFPYRLADDYKAEDYFEFRASAFVGKNNGGLDGILLRTDIDYSPAGLHHVLLHELAHIFCIHHELDGESFYDKYCVDYASTREEDGMINAGYAVWREMIAEVIAIECDDAYDIQPLRSKKSFLRDYMNRIAPLSGKLYVSMILTEIMTSSEVEMSETWDEAVKYIQKTRLFKEQIFLDFFQTVFVQLRTRFLNIDVDFIRDIGYLYLTIVAVSMMQKFGQSLT